MCKSTGKILNETIEATESKILNWKVESILVIVLSKFREGKILRTLALMHKILFMPIHKIVFFPRMDFRFRIFMLLKEKKEILSI